MEAPNGVPALMFRGDNKRAVHTTLRLEWGSLYLVCVWSTAQSYYGPGNPLWVPSLLSFFLSLSLGN